MSTKYRISEDDYVNASSLFGKLTSRQTIIWSFSIVILLTFALFASGTVKYATIAGVCSAIIFFFVARHIISPIISRSQYKKYKAIQDEFEIDLLDDGVFMRSSSGNGKVAWSSVYKWRQDDKYVLIFPMPRLYYIVPKSLNTSEFDISLLVKQLTHHVGDSA